MKLRKGDRVQVIAGKDKGREGAIMRVLPAANKVIVEGVNMAKKHQRPTRATMQGGIIDKDLPIHASNVMLICNTDGPVRASFVFDDDGAKVRVCKRCGGEI